jgi:AcrR family transcriptional regulator
MTSTRLSPEKWIATGLDALCADGPSSLAAEPMARRLDTTKGSFYWHFKDVPAYHAALVRHWHTQALAEVVAQLEATGAPDARLRAFGHALLDAPSESALRVWAQSDKHVATIMAEVDAERLTYIQHLINQFGLRNPAFAQAILAALTGLPQLQSVTDPHAAFDALVDTILALS